MKARDLRSKFPADKIKSFHQIPIRSVMVKANAKPIFIISALGVLLLGGFAFYLLLLGQEMTGNAAVFRKTYLASIQHAIDLGKNLNAYSDFIQEELRSPRGREPSLFVEKAQSSLRLMLSKELLPPEKKKETEQSIKSLFSKADSIFGHLRQGETELARKIYDQEYSEGLKSFHMELDSHKKYLQTKSSRFFSKHVATSPLGFSELATILALISGFAFLGLGLLAWRWHDFSNKNNAHTRELSRKVDEMIDHNFRVGEIFVAVRELCQGGLAVECEKPEDEANLPKGPEMDFEELYSSLERFGKYHAELFSELRKRTKSLEDLARQAEASKEKVQARLRSFSKFRVQLINSGLKGKNIHGIGGEVLELLEDLESEMPNLSLSEEWIELERSLAIHESKGQEMQTRLEESINSVKHAKDRCEFEMKKGAKDMASFVELTLSHAEVALGRKNEFFTNMLVLTDPHELEDPDFLEEFSKKAA